MGGDSDGKVRSGGSGGGGASLRFGWNVHSPARRVPMLEKEAFVLKTRGIADDITSSPSIIRTL